MKRHYHSASLLFPSTARPQAASSITPTSMSGPHSSFSGMGHMLRAGSSKRYFGTAGVGAAATSNTIPASANPTHRAGPFDPPLYMGSSTPFVVTNGSTLACLEDSGELTHHPPSSASERACVTYVKGVRWVADKLFRERYIHRATMLTTIASCPAFAASVLEHFGVIWGVSRPRRFRALMGEAENHQVHLAILSELAPLTIIDRVIVTLLQLVHCLLFGVLFAVCPKLGHRLSGYFAEESAVMYTHFANDIDVGKVNDLDVPQLAVDYWGLAAKNYPASATTSPLASRTPSKIRHQSTMEGVKTPPARNPHVDLNSTIGGEVLESEIDGDDSSPTASSRATPSVETQNSSPLHGKPVLRDVALLMRAEVMLHRDAQHQMADEFERLEKAGKNA